MLLGFVVAGLFFLIWWLYDAISLGIFALPATFFLVSSPRSVRIATVSPRSVFG